MAADAHILFQDPEARPISTELAPEIRHVSSRVLLRQCVALADVWLPCF